MKYRIDAFNLELKQSCFSSSFFSSIHPVVFQGGRSSIQSSTEELATLLSALISGRNFTLMVVWLESRTLPIQMNLIQSVHDYFDSALTLVQRFNPSLLKIREQNVISVQTRASQVLVPCVSFIFQSTLKHFSNWSNCVFCISFWLSSENTERVFSFLGGIKNWLIR